LGRGHCEYGFGVPERLKSLLIIIDENWIIITTRNACEYDLDEDD
jgi:hypothetical protein